MPNQDNSVTIASVPHGFQVDLGYQGTRRVYHTKAFAPCLFPDGRSNAVGGEYNRFARWHVINIIDEDGLLLLEILDYMRVVDYLMTDVYGGSETLQA
jgi:hypothetical protein